MPDAPTNLTVAVSATGLNLTWKASLQDPGCVSGYEIAHSLTSGSDYSKLDTVAKGILKYKDTTVEADKTYYYEVRASGGAGFSDY